MPAAEMVKGFTHRKRLKVISRACVLSSILALTLLSTTTPAAVQEQIYFPAHDDAEAQIVARINAESVRLDVAVWLLDDGLITQAIINRFQAGVQVRVLGDRAGLFESDPHTRASFERLASAGIPIRLRYFPTDFPQIIHWKYGGFSAQNSAVIGSGNWTSFELNPVSSTNFKDETEMFTNDPTIVNALRTQFDRFWVDTTYFLDWPAAYKRETGIDWTTPMNIQRVRLEPDYPTDALIWGQGPEIINPMIAEINAENTAIDVISYRLTVPSLTDALIARQRAGVQMRVFIEPTQYRSNAFPEYWLVGNEADRLWVAGIPIKIRTHDGLTHAKTLITSRSALLASSNYTKNWERDHNYFIQLASKPTLYSQMKNEFNRMWNDTANYTNFKPLRPEAVSIVSPAAGAINVPTQPTLTWNRAPWAVAFDVYLGTSLSNMTAVARVNAVLNEDPPQTYSYTPSQPLRLSTTYCWKVVSRTFATDVDPTLIASTTTIPFTTGGSSGVCGATLPATPTGFRIVRTP
jgi:PLD-like domain